MRRYSTHHFIYSLFILSFLVFSTPVQSKVLELFVQPQVGGMGRLYGFDRLPWKDDQSRELNTEDDYFKMNQGGYYGMAAGMEFMFLKGIFELNQTYQSSGISSTFISLMFGLDGDFPVGDNGVFTIYALAGGALGTINSDWLKEEQPQIGHEDLNSQILMVRSGMRYEYKLSEMFRLSFDGGIGFHILQLSQQPANADNSQCAGIHAYAQAGLRIVFDVFGKKDKNPEDE